MRAWLQQHGFWRYGDDKRRDLTHVFLDGGKASVPVEALPDFLRHAACQIVAGHEQFAVERIDPERFKFFMDFDMSKEQDHLCDDLGTAVMGVVDRVTDSASRVVWCKKPNAAGRKSGMHLIWPDLVVDATTAECICSETVDRLLADGFEGLDRAVLSKIIDSSVYRGGTGLRMLFSRKRDSRTCTSP